MALKAFTPNATLKTMGAPFSTDRLLPLIADAMRTQGVEAKRIRLAGHNIPAAVQSEKGRPTIGPPEKLRRQERYRGVG